MLRVSKRVISAMDNRGAYLVRWSLELPWGSVKLHHILRSDEDRDCHDHPWSFLSVILWGGYWEHRPQPCIGRDSDGTHDPHPLAEDLCRFCGNLWRQPHMMTRRWHGPGRVLWRPAPSIHRLELPPNRTAWSLVFTGPKRREWGFRTICGFIPWYRYEGAKADGC